MRRGDHISERELRRAERMAAQSRRGPTVAGNMTTASSASGVSMTATPGGGGGVGAFATLAFPTNDPVANAVEYPSGADHYYISPWVELAYKQAFDTSNNWLVAVMGYPWPRITPDIGANFEGSLRFQWKYSDGEVWPATETLYTGGVFVSDEFDSVWRVNAHGMLTDTAYAFDRSTLYMQHSGSTNVNGKTVSDVRFFEYIIYDTSDPHYHVKHNNGFGRFLFIDTGVISNDRGLEASSSS